MMTRDEVEEARDLLQLLECFKTMRDPKESGLTVTFANCDGRGVHLVMSGHPQSKDPRVRRQNALLMRFWSEARADVESRLTRLGVEV